MNRRMEKLKKKMMRKNLEKKKKLSRHPDNFHRRSVSAIINLYLIELITRAHGGVTITLRKVATCGTEARRYRLIVYRWKKNEELWPVDFATASSRINVALNASNRAFRIP